MSCVECIRQEGSTFVLRIDRGEELLHTLREYCTREEARGGSICAIGAAEALTLSWYDVDAKSYSDREYAEKLEIVSLLGNISTLEGQVIVHLHGSFSNERMEVFGGHVKRLVVGATCELTLHTLTKAIGRERSDALGLHLLTGA